MKATGVIFAALDCDADAIEDWNRWYDLDHTPANVVLPGVQLSRRYVATPPLHEQRLAGPGSAFAGGRSTFLTIYTLCEDPKAAFDEMSAVRERLVAADRMFADEKKAVRDGDVYRLEYALAAPGLRATDDEVPFICHQAAGVVQRRGSEMTRRWYRDEFAPAAVSSPGALGLISLTSLNRPGLDLDLILFDGDPATATAARREKLSHHPDVDLVVDGAFLAMEPLSYPWAGAIRASSLPPTVG
jgi:hypothetical protein